MSKYKKVNIIADICKLMNIDPEDEQALTFNKMKCIELLTLKMKLTKDLKIQCYDSDSYDFAQRAGCSTT